MRTAAAPILVVVEQRDGALRRSALEALGAAERWGGGETYVVSLTLGAGAERAAGEALARGASQALWWDDASAVYLPLRWLRVVARASHDLAPAAVLFADSSLGRDLAPRLAARLGCPFVAGGLELRSGDSGPLVLKPLFGGRFVQEVPLNDDRPMVMTWRGCGSGPVAPFRLTGGAARRIELSEDAADLRVQVAGASAPGGRDLAEADIVVCGGRGVGSRDGFRLIYELAEALGGAPAASRAAVDAGYAPPELQVGQSGKTVSPRFYFALGVAGSLQHQAGMRNSRCVIAVNRDPSAPILTWADYGVVGDLHAVVPALRAALRPR